MAAPARSATAGGRPGTISLEPDDPLIKRLGRSIQGPIVGTANVLDVPGSVVRDLVNTAVTGKWTNPIDQLAPWNWTSSDHRSTGRDIRVALGLGKRSSRGLGGLPADILTEALLDPLTYLSPFGALTKAGKIAQAAGVLGDVGKVAGAAGRTGGRRLLQTTTKLSELLTTPEALRAAERAAGGAGKLQQAINEPLRGALGYGLFGSKGAVGTGKVAQKIAGVQDKVGEAIRYSAPVKALASAFHKPVEGIRTTAVQKAAGMWFEESEKIRAKVQARTAKHVDDFMRVYRKAGPEAAEKLSAAQMRVALENPSTTKKLGGIDYKSRQELYAEFPELEGLVDNVIADVEGLPGKATASGLPAHLLFDVESEYFPAFKSRGLVQGKAAGGGPKVFNTFDPSFQIERLPWRRHVAGGTEGVKRILADEDIQRMVFRTGPSAEAPMAWGSQTGMSAMEALKNPKINNFRPAGQQELADEIERKFGDFFLAHDSGYGLTPRQAISEMANWLRTRTPAELAVGVWGNHPFADYSARMLHGELATGAADTVVGMLSDMDFINWQGRSGARVRLPDVLKEAGLTAAAGDVPIAMQKIADKLGMSLENVRDMTLAKEHADDIGRFLKGFTAPDSTGPLADAVDWFTNTFRGLVTGPWPAFHGRNFGSSQFANWVANMWSGWSVGAGHNLLVGKTHAKLKTIPYIVDQLRAEGLAVNDKNAADLAWRLIFAHDLVPHAAGDVRDVVGPLANIEISDLESMLKGGAGGLKGITPVSGKKIARTATGLEPGTSWKPWQVRGTGGRTQSEFAPAAAGEELGSYIEGLARIPPFLHQLEQGVDPFVAAQKVKAAQVDYSGRKYTAAERQVLARLFPFYKFTSRTLPFHLRMLIDQPGGRFANTLRVTSRARGDDQTPLPEHIADTAAIPIPEGTPFIGPQPGGDPRYLTGTGLMFEDAIGLAPWGNGGLQGTGLEVMSRMNPLIKGPLEFATGESFFQRGAGGGRDLEDLDPVVGRTMRNVQQLYQGTGQTGYTAPVQYAGDQYVESLLGNTPLARVGTTLRTLTDPRKSITAKGTNLLTGLRLSDVSENAQAAALQARAQELLQDFPQTRSFARTYIPKQRLSEMSEADRVEAQQLLQLLDMLAERGRKNAKKRK